MTVAAGMVVAAVAAAAVAYTCPWDCPDYTFAAVAVGVAVAAVAAVAAAGHLC